MKPKCLQSSDSFIKSPLQTQQFATPVYVGGSMTNSAKKSSREILLTERSTSRNKVLIPNSHKLATFFNVTRPHSSQKSYSTTSTDDLMRKPRETGRQVEARANKIEFLKYNVNSDYFDEKAEQTLRAKAQKAKETVPKNGQSTSRALFLRQTEKRQLGKQLNRQHTYRSETLIRHEKALQFPKIKQPNPKQIPQQFFARPIQKLACCKQKARKPKLERYQSANYEVQLKNRGKNSLQYTFGLNY